MLSKAKPTDASKGKGKAAQGSDSDSDSDIPLPIRKARSKAPPRGPALFQLKWLRVVIGELKRSVSRSHFR